MLRKTTVVLLVLSGCHSLDLPNPPPPPHAGTLQATLLYAQPGRTTPVPAVGASIELVNTSISTTVSESNGHFTLAPVNVTSGTALIRFDANGDGVVDAQRLIDLAAVHTGPDRDVVLGELVLGANATVQGRVLVGDRPGATSGLAGTSVFVQGGPFITYTADDGSFALEGMPEGTLTLTFYREGYASSSSALDLRANERFTMNPVVLQKVTAPTAVRVSGRVELSGESDFSGVTVSISGTSMTATSDAQGHYELAGLAAGRVVVGFTKSGFKTAVMPNVLLETAETTLPLVTLGVGDSLKVTLDAGVPPVLVIDAGVLDAGFDAGLEFDAGTIDAGTLDAGLPDAGFDAGVIDAGFDAGVVDAGVDSGVADAGVDAGVVDAGPPPPTAVVNPIPVLPTSTSYQLNGNNSVGTRPFSYRWTQDAGPTISIPNNGSISAATPTIFTPNTTSLLKMALTVTDALGVASAPTDFTIVVSSGAPSATIAPQPPATVYAGQLITVGSTGSTAPNGSGLSSYEWTVLPSNLGIVVTPLNGGSQLQLTMPATVSTSTAVSISLNVVDGLGVRSAMPATSFFTLSSAAAPTWQLDAGPVQVVAGGTVVTLSALAVPPSGSPTFSYQWSPAAVTDAGVANWALLDPNAATTQFLAPTISGPSLLLNFTATATVTSGGLTPTQRTASTLIQVQDRRSPQVQGTSINGGTSSPFGFWIDFDEDMQSGPSVPTIFSLGSPSFPGVRSTTLYNQRRFRMVYEGFAPQDAPLRLATNNPKDVSPYNGGNQATASNIDYFSSFAFPSPAVALDSSTEPNPAVVLVSEPGGEASAYLLSRRDQRSVIHQKLPLFCDAGCTVTEDTLAPLLTLGSNTKRVGNRVVTASGVPYVMLQTQDYEGDAGVAVGRFVSSWGPIASPPGTLFTDGVTLFSAYVQAGSVKVASYDPMLDSWGSVITVATSAADYTPTAGSVAQAWGAATTGGGLYVVTRTTSGDLKAWGRASPANSWSINFTVSNSPDPIKDFRIGVLSYADPAQLALVLHASGQLETFVMGNSSGTYLPYPTGIRAFDVTGDATLVWMATIEANQLIVRYRSGFGGVNVFVPGPPRGGPPSNSLNFDINCVADSPAISKLGEHLVVAWEEKCGTGPWKTYLRYVR